MPMMIFTRTLNRKCTFILALILLLFTVHQTNAQTLAFPGAQGFGRFAKGARGAAIQEVYVVTNLNEIANELSRKLCNLFLLNEEGRRPIFGQCEKMQQEPHFKNYILFYEYFDGNNGRGAGACHQTGLVAKLLQPRVDPLLTIKDEKAIKDSVSSR
jgi:hypothetical protein